jgi:hypothetical protein
VDRWYRKLAHRGSYQQLVWVSSFSFRRVLVEHRLILPGRSPVAAASAGRGRARWCGRPTGSGCGTSRISPGRGGSASRSSTWSAAVWIDTLVWVEDSAVQVMFGHALETTTAWVGASAARARY